MRDHGRTMSTIDVHLPPPPTTTIPASNLGTITSGTSPNNPNLITTILSESSHPTALLFHFAFRTAALIVYLFFSWFLTDSFVLIFVLTVVLLAVDFWTVKNVTGRMLVGKRWWNDTATDGSTLWTFEAKSVATFRANPIDARLFWGSLYGYSIVWACLGLLAILRFSFSWLLVVAFALTMNITNLVGYLKCDQDSKSQNAASIGGTIIGNLVSNKINALFSK